MNRNDLYRKALSVFPYCTHGLDEIGQVIIYTGIKPDPCYCGNNGDADCTCGYADEQSDIALLFETVNDVILRIEQLEQEASDEGTD